MTPDDLYELSEFFAALSGEPALSEGMRKRVDALYKVFQARWFEEMRK